MATKGSAIATRHWAILSFFLLSVALSHSSALTAEAGSPVCEGSATGEKVIIDGCVTDVDDVLLDSGCTLSERIMQCAEDAQSHGEFVSCTALLTKDLVQLGTLTGREKGTIQACAARASIPSAGEIATYCFTMVEGESSIYSTEISFERSGDTVVARTLGLTMTGTVSGNTMTLEAEFPDGTIAMVLDFSDDLTTFEGTLTESNGELPITGTLGACTDYTYPTGEPTCILPVNDLSVVTGGQQYNSVSGGVRHSGIDFRIDQTLRDIVAPCDGVIMFISQHSLSLGNIAVDVGIKYNDRWTTFVAFEPYSPDEEIAEQQRTEIAVSIHQIVRKGDLLGRLVVPEPPVFPHVHWGLNQDGFDVCPRDSLVPEDQADLDALYTVLGLYPPCLP